MPDSLPDPPDLDPAALSAGNFSRSRKGFDPVEVNQTLGRAADALRTWQLRDRSLSHRIEALEGELVDAHKLDEGRIASVLGEETARVISAAREAAAEIRSKAEEHAARLIRESEDSATASANALRAEAETLRAEADKLRQEATREYSAKLEEAERRHQELLATGQERYDELLASGTALLEERRAHAESLAEDTVEDARSKGREMVSEARAVRDRILADLAERRRVARIQIESAVAGRDRIVEVIRSAGAELDGVLGELATAEDLAREAATRVSDSVEDDSMDFIESLELSEPTEPILPGSFIPDGQPNGVSRGCADGFEEVAAATVATEEVEEPSLVVDATIAETVISAATFSEDDESEEDGAGDLAAADGDAARGDSAADQVDFDDVAADQVDFDDGDADQVDSDDGDADRGDADRGDADEETGDRGAVTADVTDLDLEADPDRDVVVEDDRGEDPHVGEMISDGPALSGEAPSLAPADQASESEPERPGSEDEEERSGATVHDLFARIRAQSAPDSDIDPDMAVGDGQGLPETLDEREVADDSFGDQDRVADEAEGLAEESAANQQHQVIELNEVPPAGEPELDEMARVSQLLDTRDELLVPVERQILRSLRRLGSDEQNGVLDRLRRHKRGRPSVEDAIPGSDEMLEIFSAGLTADFAGAVEAGQLFWERVGGTKSTASASSSADPKEVRPRLESLLSEFISVHRAHLERAVLHAEEEGVDTDGLVQSLKAVYRDWRAGSLGAMASDLAIAGFSQGERSAAGPGTPWMWVVDNGGLPCADGEDNALAGIVLSDEAFPTGDLAPPAHPGCRCILVPAHN